MEEYKYKNLLRNFECASRLEHKWNIEFERMKKEKSYYCPKYAAELTGRYGGMVFRLREKIYDLFMRANT